MCGMQGMARSSLFVNIVHKLEANRKTHALPLNRFVTGPGSKFYFTVQDFVLFRSLILRKA